LAGTQRVRHEVFCLLRQVFPAAAQQEPMALDLLARLLTYDPQRRISAQEAMLHPYFAECGRAEAAWTQLHELTAASAAAAGDMPAHELQGGAKPLS